MRVKVTIIGGKVHDVGYRPFLLDLADSLLIERFDARNVVIKGREAVIVLVEGDEDQINQFIELVKKEKPENAVVEDIKVEEFKGFVRSIDSYRQSLMVNQLNKIVQVGLQMLKKQDLMLHKQDLMLQRQDLMLQKQDQMLQKQDLMLEKMDAMLQKQDETIKIIREESEKSREYLGKKIDQAKDEVVQEIGELRMDLKTYLDERLKKIEEEINAIKSKLGMI
jgi:acylphosphatase